MYIMSVVLGRNLPVRCTGLLISPYPDQEGIKLGSMSGTRAISTTSRRGLSSFFFLQGKAPKEIHAILTETVACFFPGWAKDLSALCIRTKSFSYNADFVFKSRVCDAPAAGPQFVIYRTKRCNDFELQERQLSTCPKFDRLGSHNPVVYKLPNIEL
jgi:hypothetical protein